jgi:hypothetical protein
LLNTKDWQARISTTVQDCFAKKHLARMIIGFHQIISWPTKQQM